MAWPLTSTVLIILPCHGSIIGFTWTRASQRHSSRYGAAAACMARRRPPLHQSIVADCPTTEYFAYTPHTHKSCFRSRDVWFLPDAKLLNELSKWRSGCLTSSTFLINAAKAGILPQLDMHTSCTCNWRQRQDIFD